MAHECFECKECGEPLVAADNFNGRCGACTRRAYAEYARRAETDEGPFQVGHRKTYTDVYVWEKFDEWQDACSRAFQLFRLHGDVRIKRA